MILKINILMSLICSPSFQFTFFQFDQVTYVTGSYRLTPRSTECKHLLKDLAFNSLQDRICLRNSLGGGGGANPFSAVRVIARIICEMIDIMLRIVKIKINQFC